MAFHDFSSPFVIGDMSETDSSCLLTNGAAFAHKKARQAVPRRGGIRRIPQLERVSSAETEFSGTSCAPSPASKHSRSSDDYENDESENEKLDKRRRIRGGPKSSKGQPLLACPYAKFDKDRYSFKNIDESQYRSCGTCFLRDIPRLKQHLYRVHSRPKHYCSICYQSFEDWRTLDIHIRLRNCTGTICSFNEKMTPEQKASLKRRCPKMNAIDCWFNIFRLLFPSTTPPTSPFASFPDSGKSESSLSYHDFLLRKAPGLLAQLLSSQLREHTLGGTTSGVSFFETLHKSIISILQPLHDEFTRELSTIIMTDEQRMEHTGTLHKENQLVALESAQTSSSMTLLKRPIMQRTTTQNTVCSVVTVLPVADSQIEDFIHGFDEFGKLNFEDSNECRVNGRRALSEEMSPISVKSNDRVAPFQMSQQYHDDAIAVEHFPTHQMYDSAAPNDMGLGYSHSIEDWMAYQPSSYEMWPNSARWSSQ